MRSQSFHHANDGRGIRTVTLNGIEIDRVVWADTERGILVFMPYPLRQHKTKKDEAYTMRLRGKIEVTPKSAT